jgi:hypothetical protein
MHDSDAMWTAETEASIRAVVLGTCRIRNRFTNSSYRNAPNGHRLGLEPDARIMIRRTAIRPALFERAHHRRPKAARG